ncbi:ankyrin repeat domain-containing protein [Pseudarthrobacter sp. O4]|uniref:ankyrin repeat domain-containing protein n=1 Tax=Pseudarthrobacter sp. O4 TaxID=3418417 RepID=UPI003CE6794F
MIDIAGPPADAMVRAIHTGDPLTVRRLLRENPALAGARFGTGDPHGVARTLLHVATDLPGHYPHSAETVTILAEAGADVSAPCTGPYAETPLHWAASSNDVEALDALLDAGADIEAPGAVFGDGTPLADAIGFGQWQAARHLIDRGARTTLWQAAATGLRSRILEGFPDAAPPSPEELNAAFWYACHGGQFNAAIYLHGRGADLNRIPAREELTPLDAARRNGAADLVRWLHTHGARSATEPRFPR